MSEAAMEKSRGLKFAEQQLLRHGWEQGKGLGRAENGISEAIRVKVGHKESEQFTFHWWDHVFNKASSRLAVESDQNGVVVKKTEEGEDGTISNKKPRKAMMNKSMLYGSFVKSATLLSGQEQPEEKLSLSEDSSSEDEEKLDLSSTKNLSDAELMKACGGRTAHKGARHGLTMSAKLARLEQQEQEFMAKYGKKKQMDKTIPLIDAVSTELSPTLDQERAEKNKKIKSKKKKRSDEHKENGIQVNNEVSQEQNEVISKKRKIDSTEFKPEAAAESLVDTDSTRKKKKNTQLVLKEEQTEKAQEAKVAEINKHQPTEESVSKKKKKKKKKHSENSSALLEGPSSITVLACEESTEMTESCEQEQNEETTALPSAPDACMKKKKKKKSKDKSLATEMDSCYSLDPSTAEVLKIEPSQSKKRKRREVELEAETENKSIDQPTEKKKRRRRSSSSTHSNAFCL
ncbi:G patch domain-containing protein 4 [Bagarius yarrelli]|uniref:G patch domain-containing protein 4 n=1 Tax=Bagarius yarrelli TaxID=175774 RepID=A0A556TQ21_BAGYA|nr:G patch domain-containing protein 4 [Bagarius yarrelli]